jgi:hypothetical protein
MRPSVVSSPPNVSSGGLARSASPRHRLRRPGSVLADRLNCEDPSHPLEGLSLHCTNPQSRRGERKTIWIFWRHAANVCSINHWERRGRDSNPRYPRGYNGFRDRPDRPLRHLSRCHKRMVMWEASPTRERPRHASLGNHGSRVSSIPPPARNRPRRASASSDTSVTTGPIAP